MRRWGSDTTLDSASAIGRNRCRLEIPIRQDLALAEARSRWRAFDGGMWGRDGTILFVALPSSVQDGKYPVIGLLDNGAMKPNSFRPIPERRSASPGTLPGMPGPANQLCSALRRPRTKTLASANPKSATEDGSGVSTSGTSQQGESLCT